jgi:hypothetical protein
VLGDEPGLIQRWTLANSAAAETLTSPPFTASTRSGTPCSLTQRARCTLGRLTSKSLRPRGWSDRPPRKASPKVRLAASGTISFALD